ncbi:phage antirepressor KilAC domain-containing protein [Streptomyces olivaceus]|uniref:phage antirepressor KilAC domain-containing protein n=1 Tax=Streptomyces olivaceus TaxID=47716 RepID=UPI001CCF8742|nr:phage antirepressor KilAC domain-containing protein [Streptomyces olivaceus]MBZ6258907.1 phage antirepressor KilAC domain-containing protein [Streptomyces olivaceus]
MATIAPPNELILTESRTMRTQTIERTDVLDKVKTLVTLPDSFHVTTEMVASYYEVPVSTLDSLVSANFEEPTENGRRVLQGSELTAFATPFGGVANLGLSPKARSLAVFNRRAVLNVGQILTRSEVARAVRTQLLNVQESSAPRIPGSFAEALELAAAQARQLEQATAALEIAAPKAEAHDRLIADGSDHILRIIAAELKVKEHWLRQQLLDWGWIYSRWAGCGALQYVPYADKRDCFSLKEKEIPHHSREGCWHVTLQVTPKGREAIHRRLARQDVGPAPTVARG